MGGRSSRVTIGACILMIIGQASIDLYLPSLPAMKGELGASAFQVQLTITFYLFSYALVQLFIGPISDRFGRRPILFVATLGSALGAAGCAMAGSIESVLIWRMVQGVGAGSGSTLSRALLRDTFSGSALAKRMSYLAIAWGAAPLVAPVIGGYLQEAFGWRSPFWFLFSLSLASFFYYLFFLHETKSQESRHPLRVKLIWQKYRTVMTHRGFLGFSLAFFFTYGLLVTYATASPILLQQAMGLSPVAYGWSMLIVALGFIIGSLTNSYLIARFRVEGILKFALRFGLLSALALLATGLFGWKEAWVIVLLVFLIESAMGYIFPNTMAGAMHPFPDHPGSSSALVGCLASLGGSLFSWVIAHLPEVSQIPLAALMTLQLGVIYLLLMGVALPASRGQE